jgi:hypothetical protein
MSDDWRQRHNFLWYVRKEQAVNAYTRIKKKLVMIPWDYDRVNDDERNRQWPRTWDDVWESGDERCAAGHQSVQERALQDLRSNQRPISELWYFEAIHSEFPDDILLPIQCEQLTKVFSMALKDRVNRRVKELADTFDTAYFKKHAQLVGDQIRDAVARDMDPPRREEWALGVRQLRFHFLLMRRYNLNKTNCHIMPRHATLRHTVPSHNTPHHTTPHLSREGQGNSADEAELDMLLKSGVMPPTDLLGRPGVGTKTFIPLGDGRLNSAWQSGLPGRLPSQVAASNLLPRPNSFVPSIRTQPRIPSVTVATPLSSFVSQWPQQFG